MKPRVALVVGCNEYTHLNSLFGACKDAERIHALLLDKNLGGYDASLSKVLLSPTLAEFVTALNDTLFHDDGVDVFTLYFAGHGAIKSGSYYLCMRDTRIDRMSATAHPLTALFTSLNESRPNQVNFIIDACNAGGLVADLGTLLKSELIGQKNSPSVSLLAAASADEYANETNEGGAVTRLICDYLSGAARLNYSSPYLDIAEIGRGVSASIDESLTQTPTAWALNLHGQSKFSRNPHYSESQSPFSSGLFEILPNSQVGQIISEHAEAIWAEYRATGEDPDPIRLAEVLRKVIGKIAHEPRSVAAFIKGIAGSFEQRAAVSRDAFGPLSVVSTFLVLMLEFVSDEAIQLTIDELLKRRARLIRESIQFLNKVLDSDKYALLGADHATADLFLLPIRIYKVLGYLWSGVLLNELYGGLNSVLTADVASLTERIHIAYKPSFVAVSDEQAPCLYVMAKGAVLADAGKAIAPILRDTFADMIVHKGNVADSHLDPAQVLRYLIHRGTFNERKNPELLANPSLLLAVMLSTRRLEIDENEWDSKLRALDHQSLVVFIPKNFTEFGRDVIRDGVNNVFQIGSGIWSMKDFREQFAMECAPRLTSDQTLKDRRVQGLAVIASITFPDRIPWFLEYE